MMIENAKLLSLVIPCYNPVGDWIAQMETQLLPVSDLFEELIVVNDGSTKLTEVDWQKFQLIFPKAVVLHRVENKGKGFTLREGVERATSPWIVFTDVDFPFTIESMQQIIAALREGADVALGTRSGNYYQQIAPSRRFLSQMFRWCIKTFLRIPTDDTQCGLKGMNQRGREVFLQTTIDRYLFDLEFVFLAARKRLKLVLVPVRLRSGVQLSDMKWKVLLHEAGNFARIFIRSILS